MPTASRSPNANHNHNLKNAFPKLQTPVEGEATALSDDCRARQNDEVEALRSIFMEDFQEVSIGPGAWNRLAEHAFKIRLAAYSDVDTAATLSVTLTSTYPMTVPLLCLMDMELLQQVDCEKVNKVLATVPRNLLGSEMIYDITSAIRDILEEAVQVRLRTAELPSLEEERAIREAATLKEEEARNEALEKQRREAQREEERLLGQMMLDQMDRQRQKRYENAEREGYESEQENYNDDVSGDGSSDRTSFDQRTEAKDENGDIISFRTVASLARLRQGPVTTVSTVKPLNTRSGDHRIILVVKRVIFAHETSRDVNLKNEIFELETTLKTLRNLRATPHPNVLDVLNFKIDKQPINEGEDSKFWTITILTQYAGKGSLEELLEMVGHLGVDKLRAWTIQILEALEYYHCNGVVHGSVHSGNILFVRVDPGSTVIKLADGGYQRHVHAMYGKVNGSSKPMRSTPLGWPAPEIAEDGHGHRSRKSDLWDFGVVFLQMALGLPTVQQYSSPVALIDSIYLSASSEEFIRKLFKVDVRKRPTAFDLLTSDFLRNDDPVLAPRNLASESQMSFSSSLSAIPPQRTRQDSIPSRSGLLRYANEFHELGRLGKGGFGEVFKARNKLDGQLYAIKKITQNTPGSLSAILSETILLSRLNHPNVVRYFNTWLEEDLSGVSDTDEDAISFEISESQPTGPTVDFGHSTGGLDILSSAGGPQIQFAYDSDDGASSCDDQGSISPKGRINVSDQANLDAARDLHPLQRTVSNSRNQRFARTTLYIQMEYCEKHTLGDLIRQGLSDSIDRCWRLFRQIVEGLSHIHGHHIIHRDLAPKNIFCDLEGKLRIGDFGLATSGQYYLVDKASASVGEVPSDLTKSIGTALYVAPELRSSSSTTHYDEKVDLYSLGIIFFEMCYPLKTGMERDQVLRSLRQKDHHLPVDFQKPEKALQGSIIQELISHRPHERPTTVELLQSGKIPLQIQDETIRQALKDAWNPSSPHYHKMMAALFSEPKNPAQDFAWDVNPTISYGPNELLMQQVVKERLVSLFRRHGAVETTRPILFPRSKYYSANVVQLLDASGTLLQLPYDLTLPNARMLAKRPPAAQKTFSFADVYRDLYTGGQPRGHGEVDFDITSPDNLDLALKEAEVITVLNEILDTFPSLYTTEMCFHISHSNLLDLILEFCRIEVAQQSIVKDVISKLNIGQWTWQKIRNELRSPSLGIASTSLDDLSRFDFREPYGKASKRILEIFASAEYSERCSPVFAHISAVITYLKGFNVQRKIYVCPLSSFNAKFYTGGLLFQCLYDGKRRDVFAAGGRYDQLIESYRPRVQNHSVKYHAVGFNLGWDKMWTSVNRYQKVTAKNFLKKAQEATHGHIVTRRCDILVASFDAQTLRSTGVSILRQLWANDMSAELAVDARSTDELLSLYKDDTHSWIIIIKQDVGVQKERVLKVKSMIRKEDADIRIPELMSWLRAEIRERDQREGTNDRAKLLRTVSQPEPIQSQGQSLRGKSSQDVRVLISSKGKRTYKRNVVEAAQAKVQELIQGLSEAPVAAVNVRDDVLDAIRNTALSDSDGWRTIIQSAPSTERKYLAQVFELLSDLAREMKGVTRDSFVYNVRTGACIPYDLERV